MKDVGTIIALVSFLGCILFIPVAIIHSVLYSSRDSLKNLLKLYNRTVNTSICTIKVFAKKRKDPYSVNVLSSARVVSEFFGTGYYIKQESATENAKHRVNDWLERGAAIIKVRVEGVKDINIPMHRIEKIEVECDNSYLHEQKVNTLDSFQKTLNHLLKDKRALKYFNKMKRKGSI